MHPRAAVGELGAGGEQMADRRSCRDADVRLTRNVPTPARVSVIEGAPA